MSQRGYHYDEDDLRRAFEFSGTFRKYLKEPSPAMYLCDKIIFNVLETKGNYYCSEQIDRLLS